MNRQRRIVLLVTLAAMVAALAAVPAVVTAAVPLPASIASTGDSITQAYNTGPVAFNDYPASSWSTGSTSSVNSHYLRLRARNTAINGHAFNDSKTGAKMVDLDGQLAKASGQGAAYVTVLIGANDACTSTVASMTSVATFGSQFSTALSHFTSASPNARIFVASVPNIQQLWSLFKNNGSARFIWSVGKVCQSMLVNPTSTSAADNARRAQVTQRVVDYNAQLKQICGQYANCRFDNNAVYNTAFTTSDVNTRDYFHPSVSGQAKLASVTWAASYWAP